MHTNDKGLPGTGAPYDVELDVREPSYTFVHGVANEWLTWLYSGHHGQLVVSALRGDRLLSVVCDSIDDAVRAAGTAGPDFQGVYVRLTSVKPGSVVVSQGQRGKAADTAEVFAIALDVDVIGPVHAKTNLPYTQRDVEQIISQAGLPQPSAIVSSGYGFYPFWRLAEPWVLSDGEHQEATRLMKAWEKRVQEAAAEFGWHVDSTAELSRVLRLPGSINRKICSDPRPVTAQLSDRAYSLTQIQDILGPEAPAPEPARTEMPGVVAGLTEVVTRVTELCRELAESPDDGDGNRRVAQTAYKIGQYVGAGQLGMEDAMASLAWALGQWVYEPGRGTRGKQMETARRQLQEGARNPRPWTASAPVSTGNVVELDEAEFSWLNGADDVDPKEVLRGEFDAEPNLEIRRKMQVRAAERILSGPVTPKEVTEWREWFSRHTEITKGEFTQLARDIRATQKQQREQAAQTARAEAKRLAVESGVLLPGPGAPLDVAQLIAERELTGKDGLLHHVRWRGETYQWVGTHWEIRPEEFYRAMIYRFTAEAQYEDPFTGEILPWNPNPQKVNGVLDALFTALILRGADQDPHDVIACRNGTLDLSGRVITEHSAAVFNLSSLPFDFDPSAECPAWERFVGQVLPDDEAGRATLQEWFGYVVSGRTDLQKIMSLIGVKRSGKGTIARVLTALIGKGNVSAPGIRQLGETFGLSGMVGKSLAIMGDVRWVGRDVVGAVPVLLGVSGEDTVSVARKNKEDWIGQLGVRFMIMSNDAPAFQDTSAALAGRMVYISFRESFSGREDHDLTGKLLEELPGIMNWALAGLDRLNARGRFAVAGHGAELAAEVERSASPMGAFVADVCELGEAHSVDLDTLYTACCEWLAGQGYQHMPVKERLTRELRAVAPKISTERVGSARTGRRMIVHGVGLVTADEPRSFAV